MTRGDCPWWAPPLLAVQFLTRIPAPGLQTLSPAAVHNGLVRAVGWFPLVGAMVGTVTAVVAIGAAELWPPVVAVALALAIEARLTGAFHEDAVADFCDAIGGGQSPDDTRRIMKDSRIGSYGALGLILAVTLRGALMTALLIELPPLVAAVAIVASTTFGRLLVVAVMAAVDPAPTGSGLAKDIGSGVTLRQLGFAMMTALPGLLVFGKETPGRLALAVAATVIFVIWFRALLMRSIGGSTGDCLGFSAYVGQLLLLLAAAAMP